MGVGIEDLLDPVSQTRRKKRRESEGAPVHNMKLLGRKAIASPMEENPKFPKPRAPRRGATTYEPAKHFQPGAYIPEGFAVMPDERYDREAELMQANLTEKPPSVERRRLRPRHTITPATDALDTRPHYSPGVIDTDSAFYQERQHGGATGRAHSQDDEVMLAHGGQDDIGDLLDPLPPKTPRQRRRESENLPKKPSAKKFAPPGSENWSVSSAGMIEDFFRSRFGRDLPIANRGQGAVHNKLGFDHRNALDVSLHPGSPEGQAVIAFLEQNNIPYIPFTGAVPGKSTGPHIHVGRGSHYTTESYPVGTTLQDSSDIEDLLDLPATGKDPYALYEADGKQSIDDLLDPVEPRPRFGLPSTSVRIPEGEGDDLTDSAGNPLSVYQQVEFPAEPERSVTERMAANAADIGSWRENSKYEPPANSPFGVSDFDVKIPGDSRRYPTQDEIRDSIIRTLGPDAQEADRRYREETGHSIGQLIGVDMEAVRHSFNPETGSYEIRVNGTNNLLRLMNAYLAGGLQRAQDEGRRIQLEAQEEGQALVDDSRVPRTWGDTARAGVAEGVLAQAQLYHNMGTAADAALTGQRHGFGYRQLQEQERREQSAIDNARSVIPAETEGDRSMLRSNVAAPIAAAPYIAAGPLAAPLAYVGNLHQGQGEAIKQGIMTAVSAGVAQGVGGFTQGMNPVARQVVSRGAGAGTNTTQAALSGETDPQKLIEAAVVGAGMPIGKRAPESMGARPGGLFEKGSAPQRGPRVVQLIEHLGDAVPMRVVGEEGGRLVLRNPDGDILRVRPDEVTDYSPAELRGRAAGINSADEGRVVSGLPVEQTTRERVAALSSLRSAPDEASFMRAVANARRAGASEAEINAASAGRPAPVGWVEGDGVIRYGRRDIIRVRLADGTIQPFYRSSGRNSNRGGEWLPFDGVVPELGNWFNKQRFTSGEMEDPAHPLHRFGTEENKRISEMLGEQDIPQGREIDFDNPTEVNEWIAQNNNRPASPHSTQPLAVDRSNGDAQFDALLNGETNYAVYAKGEKVPALPDGYVATKMGDGSCVIHPESVPVETIRSYARNNLLDVLDMTDADGVPVVPSLRAPEDAGVFDGVPSEPRRPGVLRTAADVVNAFKSVKSSGDVSALLRQGLMFISEPRAWYRGMKEGMKALSSEQYARISDDIALHPMRDLAEESGLFLATQGGGYEEAFPSRLVENAPVIKQSQNSFNATLDVMRLETFSKYAEIFEAEGITPESNPKAYTDLARRINSMSGRGSLGRLEPYAEALNVPMFSPRLIKARFDILNPVEYARMDPRVRRIAMAQTAKVAVAVLSTMMLARAAGAEVETDFESSDFGKIKVGDTRWDITAGMGRYVRVMLQLGARVKDGEMGDAGMLLLEEARKNLSPVFSYGVNAAVGSDVTGEEFEVTKDTLKLITPLMVEDLMEAFDAEGWPGVLKALPAGVGVGVQTYGEGSARHTEEVLKGHQKPYRKPVNEKANAKIAADPELRTINAELQRLELTVGKAQRHTEKTHGYNESKEEHEKRLARQEPQLEESLYEFITSPEYQNLTDVERKAGIRQRVQEIRGSDVEQGYDESGALPLDEPQFQHAPAANPAHLPGTGATVHAPVAESPETIKAHFRAAVNPDSDRFGVLVTAGAQRPRSTPKGFVGMPVGNGEWFYLHRPKAAQLGIRTVDDIRAFASERENIELALDIQSPVADTSQGLALRTEDAQGRELETRIVDSPAALEAQAAGDAASHPEAARQRLLPAQEAAAERASEQTQPGWESFASGLGVARSAMPQIKSEHRGALIQFLKRRGITHTTEDVDPSDLKPSQREYSPEKINRALNFQGPERKILISSDDYVLDGHHQWLAALPKKSIPAIRLNAPIRELLIQAARFPSSYEDEASRAA